MIIISEKRTPVKFTPRGFLRQSLDRAIDEENKICEECGSVDQIRKTKQSIEKLDLRKKENQTIAVQKVHNLVKVSNCGVCSALRLISSDLYEYYHIPAKERKAIPKFDNLTETDPENSKIMIKKKRKLNPDRPIHYI